MTINLELAVTKFSDTRREELALSNRGLPKTDGLYAPLLRLRNTVDDSTHNPSQISIA
jgi:hypothetical protein